ncbi:hypothetical protein AB0M43_38315 [Longispora sp. NPDC051575]|uniref:hypothetical protein n=1 Tax=Longispora sp. NPDC051575 TaxID=3154943 RepID=UPI003414A91F
MSTTDDTGTVVGILDTRVEAGQQCIISLDLMTAGQARQYWMLPGTYTIRAGRTGLLVTGTGLDEDQEHVLYRAGRPVAALPTLDGDHSVDPTVTYRVQRLVTGDWELIALH